MMKLNLKLTSVLCILSLPLASHGGGISSGGGDNLPADANSAWFLDGKEIRYCVDAAPDFGATASEMGSEIRTAFTQWASYLERKKVNDGKYTSGRSGTYNSPKNHTLTVNAKALPKCDGTENVTFYMGNTPDKIKKYFLQFFNPTAFAQRTSYDPKNVISTGFVWIAKGHWNLPYRLQGIILHEIGHMLGTGHASGTIMDEKMGEMVLWDEQLLKASTAKGIFAQIDNKKELYLCEKCEADYAGEDDPKLSLMSEEAFQFIFGRAPSGRVSAHVSIKTVGSPELKITLSIGDAQGNSDFILDQPRDEIDSVFGDQSLFNKAFPVGSAQVLDHEDLGSNGISNLQSLTLPSGKKVLVVVTRNMGTTQLTIKTISNSKRSSTFLFISKTFF